MPVDHTGRGTRDVLPMLRLIVGRLLRHVRALQDVNDRTTDDLLRIGDALDALARSGSADGVAVKMPPRPRPPRPASPRFASKVVPSILGPSTFVVGDEQHRVRLTKGLLELLAILSAGAADPAGLPDFKGVGVIVGLLRTKYNRPFASRRSVVAGICRLRDALGPMRDLVENRPGVGYRLRLKPPL